MFVLPKMDVPTTKQTEIEDLPFEILEMIMTYLNPSDRREMSLVNKNFATAADSVSDITLNFKDCLLNDTCAPLRSFLVPSRTYKRLIIGKHYKISPSVSKFCDSIGPQLTEVIFEEASSNSSLMLNTLLRRTVQLSRLTIQCRWSDSCVLKDLDIGILPNLTHLSLILWSKDVSKTEFANIIQHLPELRNLTVKFHNYPADTDHPAVNYLVDFIEGSQVTNLVIHGLDDRLPFMITSPQLTWRQIDFPLISTEMCFAEFLERHQGTVTVVGKDFGLNISSANMDLVARKCLNLQELEINIHGFEPIQNLDFLCSFKGLKKAAVRCGIVQEQVEHKLHELQKNLRMKYFQLVIGESDRICRSCFRRITESYSNLRTLDLDAADINDEDLKFVFNNLQLLRDLRLSFCNITSAGLAGLSNLKGLQTLDIIKVVTDVNLCNDFCLPELREVRLAVSDGITDAGVDALVKNCPALESVDLSHCHGITNAAVEIISKNLVRLKTLILIKTDGVTGDAMKHLMENCQKVQYLTCDIDDFEISSVSIFSRIGSLRCVSDVLKSKNKYRYRAGR